jgi:hypothetical protein
MGIDPRNMWAGIAPDMTSPVDPAMSAAPMNAASVADPHLPADLEVPATPPHTNFIDRIMKHVFHTPSALEGQFSSDDERAMRARALINAGASMASGGDQFLPALMKGYAVGQNSFQNDLQTGVKTAAEGDALTTTRENRVMDAQIAKMYPAAPNETFPQQMVRMSKMAAAYASMGNTDRAKALADTIKSMRSMSSGETEKGYQKVHDTAGNYGVFNPANGKFFFTPEEGWVTNHHDTGVDTLNAQRERRMNATDKARWQSANQFERGMYEKAAVGFMDDVQVKPAATAYNGFRTLKATLHEAYSNPAGTQPLTGQLAAFADPRARLQMQMMLYLENINPGLAAELSRWAHRAKTGLIPSDQLDDVGLLVDAIEKASEEGVRSARARYIKSASGYLDGQLLDKMLPLVEDLFGPVQEAPKVTEDAVDRAAEESDH